MTKNKIIVWLSSFNSITDRFFVDPLFKDFEREDRRNQVEERGTWNEVEIDETPVDITRPADAEESTILEQEPDVATGIAGALKVAMNKGYLDKEQLKRGGPSKMRHLQVII